MPGNGSHHKHSKGHGLMMLLCCIVAVGALAYYFLGGKSGSGSPAFILMLLLCPLMHLFMMGSHGHKNNEEECTNHGKENSVEKK